MTVVRTVIHGHNLLLEGPARGSWSESARRAWRPHRQAEATVTVTAAERPGRRGGLQPGGADAAAAAASAAVTRHSEGSAAAAATSVTVTVSVAGHHASAESAMTRIRVRIARRMRPLTGRRPGGRAVRCARSAQAQPRRRRRLRPAGRGGPPSLMMSAAGSTVAQAEPTGNRIGVAAAPGPPCRRLASNSELETRTSSASRAESMQRDPATVTAARRTVTCWQVTGTRLGPRTPGRSVGRKT